MNRAHQSVVRRPSYLAPSFVYLAPAPYEIPAVDRETPAIESAWFAISRVAVAEKEWSEIGSLSRYDRTCHDFPSVRTDGA